MTKRALATETLQLLANNLGGMLIGLVGTILITRALGPEARGVYAWILTLVSLAAAMSLLTPYNVARKLGAEDATEKTWPTLIGTLSLTNLAATLLTLPLLVWAMLQPVGENNTKLLVWAWSGLPLTVVGASLAAFIHLRRNPTQTLVSMVLSRGSITALTVLLWAVGGLTLASAVTLNVLLALISFLIFLSFLAIPLHTWKFSGKRLAHIKHFLGASWVSGMALFAMPKVPLLLLPHHATLSQVGHFSLATTLLDIAIMFPAAAASVLVTHFTRSGSGGQKQAMVALLVLISGMSLIGYILAPYLIPFVFGTGFTEAVAPFRLLLLALFLQAPLAVWGSAVMASGSARGILIPPLAGLAASLTACFLLLPSMGMMGAVWAVIAGYAVQTLTLPLFRSKAKASAAPDLPQNAA